MTMNTDMISSRGFLKGDKALGQVQVKLTPFDNKCEIHDCFDVSVNLVYSLIDVFMVDPNISVHILHTVLCTFPKEPDLYVQIVYKYIDIFFSLKVMDTERGRKAVGGKLEVHMRIREPLVDKDVKVEKWKWLVIDVHLTSRKVSVLDDLPAYEQVLVISASARVFLRPREIRRP